MCVYIYSQLETKENSLSFSDITVKTLTTGDLNLLSWTRMKMTFF